MQTLEKILFPIDQRLVMVSKEKYPSWNLGQGVGFTYNLRSKSVNPTPGILGKETDLHSDIGDCK